MLLELAGAYEGNERTNTSLGRNPSSPSKWTQQKRAENTAEDKKWFLKEREDINIQTTYYSKKRLRKVFCFFCFFSAVRLKKKKVNGNQKFPSYAMLSLRNKELNKTYYPEMFHDWKNTQCLGLWILTTPETMNRELIGRIKHKRNKEEHYANIHGRTEVALNGFLKGIYWGSF